MKKLSELISNYGEKRLLENIALIKSYKRCVGDIIARISFPVKLEKKKLLVAVEDNIWITELNFMKNDILQRFKSENIDCNEIQFILKRNKTKPNSKTTLPQRNISHAEHEIINEIAEHIECDELKISFKKAMESYFTVYSADTTFNIE